MVQNMHTAVGLLLELSKRCIEIDIVRRQAAFVPAPPRGD